MAIIELGVLAKDAFRKRRAGEGLLLFFSNTAGREAAPQPPFKQGGWDCGRASVEYLSLTSAACRPPPSSPIREVFGAVLRHFKQDTPPLVDAQPLGLTFLAREITQLSSLKMRAFIWGREAWVPEIPGVLSVQRASGGIAHYHFCIIFCDAETWNVTLKKKLALQGANQTRNITCRRGNKETSGCPGLGIDIIF